MSKLNYMLPKFAKQNTTNMCIGDSIYFSDSNIGQPLLSRQYSNISNIILGKLCAKMAFAKSNPISTFISFVRLVLFMGAQPKMLWITARRIVARMANAHPIGDIAISKLPCNPVSKLLLFVKRSPSVSMGLTITEPHPTSINSASLIGKTPKILSLIRHTTEINNPNIECQYL